MTPAAFAHAPTPMLSKLDQLRAMTLVVADTGDLDAIARLRPADCTTNPSLVLKAFDAPGAADLVSEALAWGRGLAGPREAVAAAVADRLALDLGARIAALIPGRVSTEVDAELSFDAAATLAKGREIVAAYAERGVPRERVLVKIASTWEGLQACEALEREGIATNMTLLFALPQAARAFQAGASLVSPFVGRILDWHAKARGGAPIPVEEDPGVASVRRIHAYARRHGHGTTVMGASFRSAAQVEALAGLDALTVAPNLLDALAADAGPLPRRIGPEAARDGEDTLDTSEGAFRWVMNEDPMATEKLAEGIRGFAADWRALRGKIRARLEE